MKVDENTQLFLLLAWFVTLVSLLAAIYLFREARLSLDKIDPKPPALAPYVVPRAEASKPKNGFVIPPPPDFQ